MVIKFLMDSPVIIGIITMLLMLSDYFLTLAQEKERREHYSQHYASYPVNTIEGNPALQKSVAELKLFNIRHLIATLIIGSGIPVALLYIPVTFHEILLGYIWGIFLIVIMQHLSNFLGYRISRRGIYGKLWMHQRTGLLIQSGRYLSISIFLTFLSVLTESQILYGVTIAGFSSSLRLYIRSSRVSPIDNDDIPPHVLNTK
jgi:hypothetical protein